VDKKRLLAIAAAAFALYMTFNLFYLPSAPTFVDEKRFIAEAKVLSETGEFRHRPCRSWEMPLTAMIYSVFWGITKSQEGLIVMARTFQALMLTAQAFLLYGTYAGIFNSRRGAFLTFICAAFYPYFIFYQGLLISETIFNTFLIAGFYFFYKWQADELALNRNFVLAHLFFGLAVYTKAVLAFLPLLFFAAAAILAARIDRRKRLRIIVASVFLYCALLSPWWLRNYAIFGEFVPYSTSAAMNLYLGNNKANIHGGAFWATDSEVARVAEINRIMLTDELAWSRAYTAAAGEFVKDNPARAIELAYLKFKRYWSVVPNAAEYGSGLYKWLSILSFGPVLVLAVVSLAVNARKWRLLSPLYVLIACFTLIHVISIASLRYRLPLEPFLILMAVSVADQHLLKRKMIWENK
jgi:4-amino-4-deoxy-L-arabinose transferase-like glycosyltransferase